MTRAEYRAVLRRLRGEYLAAVEHSVVTGICRLDNQSVRDGCGAGKRSRAPPRNTIGDLRLLDATVGNPATEELVDPVQLIQRQILELQLKYAMDWITPERVWTVKQLAKGCEIPVELAQMILDSLMEHDQG